jgi:hypothetical protein
LGAILVAAGLLPLRLLAAQNGEAPRLLRLRMSKANVKLIVEDEREKRYIRSTEEQIQREMSSVEPTVGLTLDGSVYHPNLVDFSGYAEVGFLYRDKLDTARESLPSGSEGEEDDLLQDYRLTLDVLREKPYAVNLLAHRQLGKRDDDFFTRIDVDTERYRVRAGYAPGLETRYREGAIGGPWAFIVAATRLEQIIENVDRPSDDREDIVEFDIFRERGPRDRTRLDYEWRDFEFVERGTSNDEGVRHIAGLTDSRLFGPEKLFHLASSLRFEDQVRNGIDSTSIDLGERATVVHNESLESRYNYTFYDRTVSVTDSRRHEGIASLRHQLFDSLTSTLEVEGRWEQDESPGSSLVATRFGGGFNERYTKRLPQENQIALDLGLRVLDQERDADGDSRVVIDERHILATGVVTLLNQPDVERSTVLVTDGAGRAFYREGLDYLLIPRDRLTQIQRVPGGFIPDGGAVLVDYRSGLQASSAFVTVEQRYGARLDLPGRLLSLYIRLHKLDNQGDPLLLLQEIDDLVVGAEGRWRWLRAGIEYQDFDTNLTPYKIWRLFQSLQLYPTRKSLLNLDLRQQSTDFLGDDDEERLFAFILRYRYRLTRSLALYAEAGTSLEDGIGATDAQRDLYRIRTYADHWIGQLTTRLEYEYSDKDFPADRKKNHRIQLTMVRRF